jgi:ABC-2 type transport system permease protein
MGTLFAAYPTESPGDIMSMLNLVRLPLIFVSGVFIPVNALPQIGQIAVLFSPLTYGNDLIRAGFEGTTHFNPLMDVLAICVFILLFQVAANHLYRKFNE